MPAEAELTEALRTATTVVDANVLLNLYRYNEATRDDLLDVRGWSRRTSSQRIDQDRAALLDLVCDLAPGEWELSHRHEPIAGARCCGQHAG